MNADDECLAGENPIRRRKFSDIMRQVERKLSETVCVFNQLQQPQDLSTCFAGIPLDLIAPLDFQQPPHCSRENSATLGLSRTFWLLNSLARLFDQMSLFTFDADNECPM
jgi:hypothetical protein